MSLLKMWKKFFEVDLDGIIYELKDSIEKPACLILSGDVGSGKTTFTKRFIKILGTEQSETTSPSYALINEIGSIAHADLYRIESEKEIVHLELPLYAEDKDYFLVEWGIPYVRHLRRELGDTFNFYELSFVINQVRDIDGGVATRTLSLKKIT